MKRTIIILMTLPIFFLLTAEWTTGQRDTSRGSDISFRGPVFSMAEDREGKITQLMIQVNRSQIGIVINDWTQVTQGRGFTARPESIGLGDFLEVTGFFTGSGAILATSIHIESSSDLEVEGVIEEIGSNQVVVKGVTFWLSPSTVLRASGSSRNVSPERLEKGQPVRLRADLDDSGFWDLRELEFGGRSVEAEPIRFEGIIREVDGPVISLDVGVAGVNALVAFDLTTRVTGPLDTGALVEVEGQFLPGTALVKARRIAVDSNENGNPFDDDEDPLLEPIAEIEIEGLVSHVRRRTDGSVTTFRINETTVRLNDATEIRLDGERVRSSAIEEGLFAEVRGTRSTTGSVLATRVELESEDSEDDADGGGEEEEDEEGDEDETDETDETGDDETDEESEPDDD